MQLLLGVWPADVRALLIQAFDTSEDRYHNFSGQLAATVDSAHGESFSPLHLSRLPSLQCVLISFWLRRVWCSLCS